MGEVYVRIDDRLIHGQIVTAWCTALAIKEIIAVDNEFAENQMLQSLALMGVPVQYKPKIITFKQAKTILNEPSSGNRLVIVRYTCNLGNIRNEIRGCAHINLGNCATREKAVHKISSGQGRFIFLTEEDVRILNDLEADGNNIICKVMPPDKGKNWSTMKNDL